MKFKYLLFSCFIFMNYVIGFPLFLSKILLGKYRYLSGIFLSRHSKFDYDQINNLVVFGDSHSFRNNQWPTKLSNIHKMFVWNYAKSGAVVDLNITYRGPGHGSYDLIKEYGLFNDTMVSYKNFIRWNGNNTLFAIHIGSNDVNTFYSKKSKYKGKKEYIEYVNNNKAPEKNIEDILDHLLKTVENIYINGGRNFLFFNIPPLELADVNTKRKNNYKLHIPVFNSLLNEKVKLFHEEHNDINIIIYNLNEQYRNIINHFERYGFVSGKEIYINNKNSTTDDKFFWYDHTHLTEKGNKIIAESIDDLLKTLNVN